MQIKLDPSTDDAPHSIDIPALTIEGREQAERIVAMINKHAAALWPKPRAPRTRNPLNQQMQAGHSTIPVDLRKSTAKK